MSLGLQARKQLPSCYKDYNIVCSHGRVYGVPSFLAGESFGGRYGYSTHPAVLSAGTREELEALIDGHTSPEVIQAAPAEVDGVPVEFAGWLPIYRWSGNCGTHPQFKHTAAPPPGYKFTCSEPPACDQKPSSPGPLTRLWHWIRNRVQQGCLWLRPLQALVRPVPGVTRQTQVRVTLAMFKLLIQLLRSGASLRACLQFLQSRHHHSQLLAGRSPHPLFLTSMPYTYNLNPWIIEIEDPTTLFYPLIQNGNTGDLPIEESPYFPIVKTLLESEQCKAIVTHVRSTARMVGTLFGSEAISEKTHYTPLGVRVPARWQRHDDPDPSELHLVFINSWCQVPENLFVRGGLDVLEAFAILRQRYPRLRLTLRTELPALDVHYHRLIEQGWVRVINRFLTGEEMEALLSSSHIFLLPAARIHVVSLLQAMSYGLAVVTSDGWGIEEYLEHERNGLVVRGRHGKVSWEDRQSGMLREYYEPMHTSDPAIVRGIVAAVSRLVENPALRRQLGRTARHDVETKYSFDHWNQGLKRVFDSALSTRPDGE